jgi:hypothetical protein
MLNNKPFYQIGTLDQGWFPDGLYAAPNDEALVSDLKAMKAMGFNAVRKHMKVDTRRWYYHADRLGLAVWQDIPQQSVDFDRFKVECHTNWNAHKNSPALIQWQPYNEGWGEGDQGQSNQTVALFNELEKGQRLVDDASGGRGFGCEAEGWPDPDHCPNHGADGTRCMALFWTGGCRGNVTDHHHYPDPELPFDLADISQTIGRPFLQGEYGGLGLNVKGHAWLPCTDAAIANPPRATRTRHHHRNGTTTSARGLHHSSTRYYDSLAEAGVGVKKVNAATLPDQHLTDQFILYNKEAAALIPKGLAGQIYTQISDIECEQSGLLTYDRLEKADFSQIKASNDALLQNASALGFSV